MSEETVANLSVGDEKERDNWVKLCRNLPTLKITQNYLNAVVRIP